MKKFIPLLLITLLISCNCPPVDTDSNCQGCLDSYKADAQQYWDSLEAAKKQVLDSLYLAAIDEVTTYRTQSIYQVDTMRENYIAWMEDTLAGINEYFDSLKGTVIYDNMFIQGDSLNQATVMFDSLGIPFVKID